MVILQPSVPRLSSFSLFLVILFLNLTSNYMAAQNTSMAPKLPHYSFTIKILALLLIKEFTRNITRRVKCIEHLVYYFRANVCQFGATQPLLNRICPTFNYYATS